MAGSPFATAVHTTAAAGVRVKRKTSANGAVCYIVSEYPAVSHTFVLTEVEAVRRLGFDIETVTIRKAPDAALLSEADRRAAATTRWIRPVSTRMLARAVVIPFLRSPIAFARTFRATMATATPGVRSHLWRLFYFVEGMILYRLCADARIRHVHAHFANVGADLARVAADFGNRVDGDGSWCWSFTMHGCTELYDLAYYGVADKVRSARFVFVVSDYTRAQLLRIVEEEHWTKVMVSRCGVDIERFRPGRDRADDRFHILFVGRIVVEKGIPVLLDAAEQLHRRGVAFVLTLVGDGELRGAFEASVRRRGLTDRVRFVGAVGHDQIVSYYQDADVFCMTSFGEGLPVVLMEALACEVPVVTPWLSGIPELVEHGVTGLLVPPARADLLADALERLACEPELRRRLGRTGRERVAQHFESGRCARHIVDTFTEVRRGA
jgi:glycosyltransferase involved in cell wall biosynthesis